MKLFRLFLALALILSSASLLTAQQNTNDELRQAIDEEGFSDNPDDLLKKRKTQRQSADSSAAQDSPSQSRQSPDYGESDGDSGTEQPSYAGGLIAGIAYGFTKVDGASGNSVILDLEMGGGHGSIGFRLNIPYLEDSSQTKIPCFTINLKLYTGDNLDGFFFNIGAMALDDGKDDEDTEEDESAVVYLAGNIGFGLVLRAASHFALITGVEAASANSQGKITSSLSFYLGLLF